MISFKKIFRSSLFTINIVLLVLLLLSAYSYWISPEQIVWFSFLGMGFPIVLLANILFFIGWLIFFQWRKAFIGIACIVLCWSSIKAYFPLHFTTDTLPDDCIKILTYNVMGFHHSNPHSKKMPNPVLQYVIDCEADIVCIQEHRSYENSRLLSPDDVKKALNMYPYNHFHRIETADPSLGIYGMSIYSKYPIISIQKIKFPNTTYNGAFKVELDIHGKKTSLINCHLETNNFSDEERQQYAEMIKSPNSQTIDAMAEKAVKKLKPAFKSRAEQVDIIAKIIKEDTNPYIIVCGDFNDTPISYTRNKIKGNLKDAFAETGCGLGITYNRNRFYFRIDYILHTKNIESFNCSVGALKDSDHYPVYTWLRLKD